MGIKHVYLPRPEAGGEFRTSFDVHHNCPLAPTLRKEMDDEDIDLIRFPVGLAGYEMPLNIPWECMASHECQVCGAWLRLLVTWTGPRLWLP